ELSSGRCLATFEGHSGWVQAAALSGDGRHALSGSTDRTLRWWELSSGRCWGALSSGRCLATVAGHTHDVRVAVLSGHGCLAVFTCDYPVNAVALSTQQPHVAVAGDYGGRVHFFDLVEPGER